MLYQIDSQIRVQASLLAKNNNVCEQATRASATRANVKDFHVRTLCDLIREKRTCISGLPMVVYELIN